MSLASVPDPRSPEEIPLLLCHSRLPTDFTSSSPVPQYCTWHSSSSIPSDHSFSEFLHHTLARRTTTSSRRIRFIHTFPCRDQGENFHSYFANTRKSIHHRTSAIPSPTGLLLTGSISPATSSSSRARQNSYATIQSPRRARRIEFQTYFVMSVMAKRTELHCHSESIHDYTSSKSLPLPRFLTGISDSSSPLTGFNSIDTSSFRRTHVDLDSWISEGSGITGCNDEFGNIPHRTGHSHLYSTGASSRPLATHDKFDGDSCARSELDLEAFRHLPRRAPLPGGYILGRPLSQTHFYCGLALLSQAGTRTSSASGCHTHGKRVT
ncbi:hypothetical protein DFP72DRAFT_1059509 [Ephemerocybe angulata]|uniref:Uncharacterized protein n=1 Tax=Ephemerocybe angulata TaxID=980116 RepID=A0A8H6MCT5_9AGAR|nr:hypothetical protein DFP72DRAFT_1059509 [Tulosesus angulatus]